MTGSPRTLAGGRYELRHPLGAGGTATVWLARDTALGVDRAIKLLEVVPEAREHLQRRLQQEARIMARLAHPNVLRVVDIGIDGERDFVVMELASGSLQGLLERSGPLRPSDALRYAVQVLSALEAAHGAGVVHRDVKPHNVLLDAKGVALLADFGIARLDDEEVQRRTRQGIAMGSFAYMPPEQRLDARSVGPAADVYATGATLFALATGGNPVDLFLAEEDSPRWERLPSDLAAIVRRATRHDPGARYPSASAMAADCVAALEARAATAAAEMPASGRSIVHEAATAFEEGGITGVRTPTALGTPTAIPRAAPPGGVPRALADSFSANSLVGPRIDAATAGPPISDPAVAFRISAIALALAGATLLLLFAARGAWQEAPEAPEPPAIAVAEASSPEEAPAEGIVVAATAEAPPPEAPPSIAAAVAQPKAKVRAVAPAGPPPLGRWAGAFNGRPAELVLDGSPAALAGTMTVRFGGNAVPTEVRGTFAAESGALVLEDQTDAADGGVYRATLAGEAFEGKFEARSGRVVPFRLTRAP